MESETIKFSQMSQTHQDRYHMFPFTCGIWGMTGRSQTVRGEKRTGARVLGPRHIICMYAYAT